MQMERSTPRPILSEAHQVEDHGGHPFVDRVPQGPCFLEPTPPGNALRPSRPDARALETFADGAGI
jgi:hypothetical protein